MKSTASSPLRGKTPDVADARQSSQQHAFLAAQAALGKKALSPVLLDVHESSSYTDYILIVSGSSDRHVQAIADGVADEFATVGIRPLGVEGMGSGQWTLIDLGDVVVHVFYHPIRDFYDLEGLWIDAPRVALDVPADLVAPAEMY